MTFAANCRRITGLSDYETNRAVASYRSLERVWYV